MFFLDFLDLVYKVLELDIQERSTLRRALLIARGSSHLEEAFGSKATLDSSGQREVFPLTRDDIIDKWYNIALLEGLSLKAPLNSPESLEARLGLSSYERKLAIEKLRLAEVIDEKDGQITKKKTHAYLPTGRSRIQVRRFHKQMIQKGLQELANTSDQDFHRRLITGFTFACNLNHLERLKAKLLAVLDEVSQEASKGDCTDVYQCNIQLFPLTTQATDGDES